MKLGLLVLDFDGVCSRDPKDMYERCRNAAIVTVEAYLNVGFEAAHELVVKSWEQYRDVMRLASQQPSCCSDHGTMTRHYDAMATHDLHVRPLDGLRLALSNRIDKTDTIILSHSGTRLVQKIGVAKLRLPAALMNQRVYGIDHPEIGFRRKDRHDEGDFGGQGIVYDSMSEKFNCHNHQCLLVDDSLPNLEFAKKRAGWQTMHIHWGDGDAVAYPNGRPDYVDFGAGDLVQGLKIIDEAECCSSVKAPAPTIV